MKIRIQSMLLTAIALFTPATIQAAPNHSERRIETLARQLEAQGDNLYARVHEMIPRPDGVVKDLVNRIRDFENSADHFRNDVVDEGAYSNEARSRYTQARRAWQEAQQSYRYLPNDRTLLSYRAAVNGTFSDLDRIYSDDRGDVKPLPLAEMISQAAGITARSEQLLITARDQNGDENRYNRNTMNLGLSRLSDLRARALTLEKSVRKRPYRDPEVRRNLQDLQDAYQRAQRPSANFNGRVRSQYQQLGNAIKRFQKLIATKTHDAPYGGQYPSHGDGLVTPIWRAENVTH